MAENVTVLSLVETSSRTTENEQSDIPVLLTILTSLEGSNELTNLIFSRLNTTATEVGITVTESLSRFGK